MVKSNFYKVQSLQSWSEGVVLCPVPSPVQFPVCILCSPASYSQFCTTAPTNKLISHVPSGQCCTKHVLNYLLLVLSCQAHSHRCPSIYGLWTKICSGELYNLLRSIIAWWPRILLQKKEILRMKLKGISLTVSSIILVSETPSRSICRVLAQR